MELVYVGYFSKVHGIKGQVVLKTEREIFIDEVNAVFVETTSGKAPHFISDIKENKGGLILSLEELDSVEKARALTGKKVFVDASFVAEEEEDFEWTGFELIDSRHGSLGQIREVSDNGVQLLVTIDFKGQEIILPLVEDFIERIDEAEKKLFFKAPEGLIDMYLGK